MGCAAVIAAMTPDLRIDLDNIFLTKIIGAGGFGTVFSGLHLEYHTWFAVKRVLKTDLLKHKGGVGMLMGELEAWKAVGAHKYIADLHFAIQDKLSCYFLMDLMMGGDLRYYIKKRIILTEPELAFLFAAISSALHHIHSRNILHRDVKPENVIFDELGFPYLTDFGVAYICPTAARTCTLSSGTKQYLAPEVFVSSHLHGPEADFWALGVMLYEVLFGKRPFRNQVSHEHVHYLESRAGRESRGHAAVTNATTSPMSSLESPLLATLRHQESLANHTANSPARDTCLCLSRAESASKEYTPGIKTSHLKNPYMFSEDQNVPYRIISPRQASILVPPLPFSAKGLAALKILHQSKTLAEKKLGIFESPSLATYVLRRDENVIRSIPPGKKSWSYKLPGGGLVCPIPEPYIVVSPPLPGPPSGKYIIKANIADPLVIHSDDVTHQQLGLSDQIAASVETGPLRNNQDDEFSSGPESFKIEINSIEYCNEISCDMQIATRLELPVIHMIPPLPDNLKIQIPFSSYSDRPVSLALRSVLEGLLETRPDFRLGGWQNYSKFVEHPWFAKVGLNWQNVEEKKASPPFVPIRSEIQAEWKEKYGLSNIEAGSIDMFLGREPLTCSTQELFDDFHHIAPEYMMLFPALKVQCEGKGSGVKIINSSSPEMKKKPSRSRSSVGGNSKILP